MLDCDILVNKFDIQLHYYVPFWTNTLGEGMNPLIPPNCRLNSTTSVLLQNGFGIK